MKNIKFLFSFFAFAVALSFGSQAFAQSKPASVQLKDQPTKRSLAPTATPIATEVKTAPVETRSEHKMKAQKSNQVIRPLYNKRTRTVSNRDVAGKKQTMHSRSAR